MDVEKPHNFAVAIPVKFAVHQQSVAKFGGSPLKHLRTLREKPIPDNVSQMGSRMTCRRHVAGSQDRHGGFGCSGQDHCAVPVEAAGGLDDHPNHRRGNGISS